MNNSRVPSLRFAGFDGDWKQQHFSDIAETRRGLIYSPEDIRSSGVRVLRSSNISEDCFTFGAGDVFVAPEAINIPFAHNGDILITAANGSTRLVGKHTIIKDIAEESAVHGGFMLLASAENPDFVNALMSAPWYSKFISLYVAGGNGAIGNLNKSDLDEQVIFVPDDLEQRVIGRFFSNLDSLITQHQHQYDRLFQTKKAMLLKMFPRPGKNIPEIRFSGFDAPWEQRKLKDVIKEFYNGKTPYRQNNTYWNGTVNWLSSGDLNRGIITHTTEKITVEGKEANGLKIIPKGTLVIAIMGLEAEGTRGNCGVLGIDTTINQACMALIVDCGIISSDFLFQWYKCFGNYYALRYAQGTKQQNYNAEILGDLDISYPSIVEQKKIGEFLLRMDNLIAFRQHELALLKNLKRSMQQKMFPQTGG